MRLAVISSEKFLRGDRLLQSNIDFVFSIFKLSLSAENQFCKWLKLCWSFVLIISNFYLVLKKQCRLRTETVSCPRNAVVGQLHNIRTVGGPGWNPAAPDCSYVQGQIDNLPQKYSGYEYSNVKWTNSMMIHEFLVTSTWFWLLHDPLYQML